MWNRPSSKHFLRRSSDNECCSFSNKVEEAAVEATMEQTIEEKVEEAMEETEVETARVKKTVMSLRMMTLRARTAKT